MTDDTTAPDARAEYERRRRRHLERADALERQSLRLSNLRVVAFLAIIALVAAIVAHAPLNPAWILAPIAAFVALVVRHDLVHQALARARAAVDHHQRGLDRLAGAWAGKGRQGQGLAPEGHPYADDLDLFGPGSLFELLCTARTPAGERALAAWLLEPAPLDILRQRHAALAELRDRLDLREDLALLGGDVRLALDPARLCAWGERPPALAPARARRLAALAALVPLLSLLAFVLAVATDLGGLGILVMTVVGVLANRSAADLVARQSAEVAEPRHSLPVLAALLRRLEREPFAAPFLVERQRRLAAAADAIAALARRVDWLEARQSPFWFPVELFTLWSLHFALAIERWRLEHGPAIAGWLAALGELEAIAALAGHAYENPRDPLPELVPRGPLVVGDELRHPLLPECVANSIDLGDPLRVVMVSGSNMSGKSTLLRTIGVNVVLALAGAPVRAARLRLSPLALGATLRVEDSLRDHASRFYAELARLRRLMELARAGDPPLLFLLDEIFAGTNSHDRRIGAEALLRAFVDRGAIGLCTTHDLALAAAITDLGERAVNVHFQDDLIDGRLVFDYRMRPGVVQRSNALALMRALGLLEGEDRPAP